MRKRSTFAGVAAILTMATLAMAPGPALADSGPDKADYKRVGYFTQWGIYGRQYFVKNLDTSGQAANLTHVNYAFGNVDATGRCASADPWADWQRPFPASESVDGVADEPGQALAGNFNQLRKLKLKYPELKVLISLGGWTLSKNFSDAVLTPGSRRALVRSCIETFLSQGVFDGFDLDWEWPGSEGNTGNVVRPEDKRNFTLLLKEFRKQLGDGYQLTAFLPASTAKIDAGFEVEKIFKYLDFATVQGYDLHGTWESVTNHQSALFKPAGQPVQPDFSVSDTLTAWTDRGAPARGLVVGIPYYGQGWTGVTNANQGLFQPATGPAAGTWGPGTDDYKVLATLPSNGFTVYRDVQAGHAWLFDGTTFWTFDDPLVITQKTMYIRQHGYGGTMVWSLDGDDANATLTKTINLTLN